jgi:hypothetical protein
MFELEAEAKINAVVEAFHDCEEKKSVIAGRKKM